MVVTPTLKAATTAAQQVGAPAFSAAWWPTNTGAGGTPTAHRFADPAYAQQPVHAHRAPRSPGVVFDALLARGEVRIYPTPAARAQALAAVAAAATATRATGWNGHGATTLNTYSHLWPTAEGRTRAAAGELWTAPLADSARTSEVH